MKSVKLQTHVLYFNSETDATSSFATPFHL